MTYLMAPGNMDGSSTFDLLASTRDFGLRASFDLAVDGSSESIVEVDNIQPEAIALADIDGDGLDDIAAVDDTMLRIFISAANHQFLGPFDYPLNGEYHAAVFRDINADGYSDVVHLSQNPAVLTVFGGGPNGQLQIAHQENITGSLDNLLIGNLTGGESEDIVLVVSNSTIRISSANETLSYGEFTEYDIGSPLRAVGLGNFIGEARAEVFAIDWHGGRFHIMRFDESLGFESLSMRNGDYKTVAQIGIDDLDQDGLDDIVLLRPYGKIDFHILNEDGSIQGKARFDPGMEAHSFSITDIDQDSYPDLVIQNAYGGMATLMLNRLVSDADGDSIPTDVERFGCTSALDLDSDDDGIPDAEEDLNQNGFVDEGELDPCDPDTDNDGIQDGTERGVVSGVLDPDGSGPLLGTDLTVFVGDSDPTTTTNATNPDTDQDGSLDGEEDANANGLVEHDEFDPNDPESFPSVEIIKIPLFPSLLVGLLALFACSSGLLRISTRK
ncbi:MAG: FG-GAP-like repeat-containing protein [Pseudomonadota bacterium]